MNKRGKEMCFDTVGELYNFLKVRRPAYRRKWTHVLNDIIQVDGKLVDMVFCRKIVPNYVDPFTFGKRVTLEKFKEKYVNFVSSSIPYTICDYVRFDLKVGEYIGELHSIEYDNLFVKAPMGVGKTTSICKALKKYETSSILVISPRRTITATIYRKFQECDVFMCNYLKTKNFENKYRLIISPNSLVKMKKIMKYDFLIIDEFMLLLEYIFGMHPKNKKKMLCVIEYVLLNCKCLIISDAFLHPYISDILIKYRKNKLGSLFVEYTAPQKFVAKERSVNWFLKRIKTIEVGYIFCETKAMAKKYFDKIDSDRKLLVTGETGLKSKMLSDPNITFRDFDVIVASPIILSGFDVTLEKFEKVYGIYNGNILSPISIVQMSGRIRCAKKKYFIRKSKTVYEQKKLSDSHFEDDKFVGIGLKILDTEVVVIDTVLSELCIFIYRFLVYEREVGKFVNFLV